MRRPALVFLVFAGGCGWNAAGSTGCRPMDGPLPLPEILVESSGIAWSRARSGVLFSHNDGGHDPVIYALDSHGSVVGEIPLSGVPNQDWEDIATASCAEGSCIYLADVGDNAEVRDSVFLYRIVDAGVYDGSPRTAETFPIRLPDGPRDVESLFLLPGEQVFLVSKGRNHPVTLFRYPPPLRSGQTVTLEAVQTLSDGPLPIPQQITGADASIDGSKIIIRSYEALTFYTWTSGGLVPVPGGKIRLRTLNEPQGEGVALGEPGEIVLSSEGARGRGASLQFLACPPWGSPG